MPQSGKHTIVQINNIFMIAGQLKSMHARVGIGYITYCFGNFPEVKAKIDKY